MPYDSHNPTKGTFWGFFSAIGCYEEYNQEDDMCIILGEYQGRKNRLPGWKIVLMGKAGEFLSISTGQKYISGKEMSETNIDIPLPGSLLSMQKIFKRREYFGRTGLFKRKRDAIQTQKEIERLLSKKVQVVRMEVSGRPLYHGRSFRQDVFIGDTLHF